MTFDPAHHHRRSIRLRHYNYSWSGVYFVTLVTRHRLCLFGEIENGTFHPNAAGYMVAAQWLTLVERFPFCEPSTFVVMPNHFHGLLIFDVNERRGEACLRPQPAPVEDKTTEFQMDRAKTSFAPTGTLNNSLGRVMQAFKSLTTNLYSQGVREQGWPMFDQRLWLRNYWERVIRDEEEWRAAHRYIENNPANWLTDKQHPDYTTS